LRKPRYWAGAVLLMAHAVAAPVLAAEQGGETDIFNADIGNFIITLLVFGLVIGILGKYAWKPLLNVLHEREQTIRDALERARQERAEAERLRMAYQAQLDQARAEATALVEEGRRDAETVRRRLQEEARQEADALLARARREIRLATDAAVKELHDQTAELAVQLAANVLSKQLSPEEHRRLVHESLAQMKSVGTTKLN